MTPDEGINPDGSAADPWRLYRVQQVEEVKCVLRVIPVWASAIVYYVSIVQQNTYVVFQALQSNRHVGKTTFQIPAATYPVFNMLTVTYGYLSTTEFWSLCSGGSLENKASSQSCKGWVSA